MILLTANCQPAQIWMVVRHGTRNPSAKVIRKMRTLLPKVRDNILEAHKDGKGKSCLAVIVVKNIMQILVLLENVICF